jgi:thiol-disulfide isomerase/thioredoxin
MSLTRFCRALATEAKTSIPFSRGIIIGGIGLISHLCLAGTAFTATFEECRDPLPVFLALDTLDRQRLSLDDYRERVVLLHFFATWCEPCRRELVALEQVSHRFVGQALAILAVDVGEPESRIRGFFAQLPVAFPILLDPDRSAMQAWRVSIFPSTYILGVGRHRIWRAEGELDWSDIEIQNLLEAVLKEVLTQNSQGGD